MTYATVVPLSKPEGGKYTISGSIYVNACLHMRVTCSGDVSAPSHTSILL